MKDHVVVVYRDVGYEVEVKVFGPYTSQRADEKVIELLGNSDYVIYTIQAQHFEENGS